MTAMQQHEPGKSSSIAYLIGQYPAIHHTFILREVQNLRALGFDLHVASILRPDRPAERLPEEEREEMRQTFYVKPANLLSALAPHPQTLAAHPFRYLKALAHTIGRCLAAPKKTPTYVLYFVEALILGHWMVARGLTHVHSHFTSSVALLATRIFPVTMSATIHGPEEFDDPVGFMLAEKVAAATFICAISDYARSQLMKSSRPEHWDKIEVAPLGVDPSVYASPPFRERPSPFQVVCVGRLAPVKAQHILLGAVEHLIGEGRNVRLRLVGDGPERESLEREVRERGLLEHVVFEGWLNQEGVREVYRQADIFALASFAEGVPVVLMEAMAMGIPCVATHITGIPELIRHGTDGLLVAPSNTEEMARAIGTLMDDTDLRRRLGASARRRVVEKYDLARNTAQLADIFLRRMAHGGHQAQQAAPEIAMLDCDAGGETEIARGEGEEIVTSRVMAEARGARRM